LIKACDDLGAGVCFCAEPFKIILGGFKVFQDISRDGGDFKISFIGIFSPGVAFQQINVIFPGLIIFFGLLQAETA